jgi:hypothetical protein
METAPVFGLQEGGRLALEKARFGDEEAIAERGASDDLANLDGVFRGVSNQALARTIRKEYIP